MRFEHVEIASLSHVLAPERVTSDELEERLLPVYERLGLSVGRLELMTGIRERRFYRPGTRPSTAAAEAGERALASCRLPRERIGLLVHSAVCRDFMEPATASVVHSRLGLSPSCSAFDLSNACLGFANALTLVASQIEAGTIEAGLVVSGEDGRPLVEATLSQLLADPQPKKRAVKAAFASLTIGSGAAACVLARRGASDSGHQLLGGLARSATQHVELCSGGRSEDHEFGGPLMETDSEALLHAGNALAADTFPRFLDELGWTRADVERVVTHQVGVAHRRLLLGTLELELERDFPTVESCGNIGSVSLPLTLSRAVEEGFVQAGQNVAALGIGSGLQCQMLGLRW